MRDFSFWFLTTLLKISNLSWWVIECILIGKHDNFNHLKWNLQHNTVCNELRGLNTSRSPCTYEGCIIVSWDLPQTMLIKKPNIINQSKQEYRINIIQMFSVFLFTFFTKILLSQWIQRKMEWKPKMSYWLCAIDQKSIFNRDRHRTQSCKAHAYTNPYQSPTSPSVQSSIIIQTGFSVITPISFTMWGWSNWRMVTAGKKVGSEGQFTEWLTIVQVWFILFS